ncbi:MAG: LemA family protein [Alphaproteobacteria bacterium]
MNYISNAQWSNYASTAVWMIVGIVVLGAVLLVGIYNRIVALRQRRKNAFADVDVQLKLRYDLVPNLVATVKGYADHEKGLLENVTNARANAMRGGGITERVKAEQALGAAVTNLMAVAENYPQLKADTNFRQLQADLSDIENKIAAARRFFNNATSEYNTTIQQFPAVLLAKAMNLKEELFFEVDVAEQQAVKTPPKVNFGT